MIRLFPGPAPLRDDGEALDPAERARLARRRPARASRLPR